MSDPNVFIWIAASVSDNYIVNSNGIKTLLAVFLITSKLSLI